jgi:pyruvate,orthophosphate dikinase
MGEDSATGVAFTRNPSTGEKALYGEFLVNAQGEDVVAGIRTPQVITEKARASRPGSDRPSLEKLMPEALPNSSPICDRLERTTDMQDLEFTIEKRQAVDAADPFRQAHRQGGAEDCRRHG